MIFNQRNVFNNWNRIQAKYLVEKVERTTGTRNSYTIIFAQPNKLNKPNKKKAFLISRNSV